MHRSRKDMKIALDFASRTAMFDDDDHKSNRKSLMIGVNKLLDSTEKRFPKNLFEGDKGQLIADIVKLVSMVSLHILFSKNNSNSSNVFIDRGYFCF